MKNRRYVVVRFFPTFLRWFVVHESLQNAIRSPENHDGFLTEKEAVAHAESFGFVVRA